jgi:NAD(P)-dependent dehydrogenase (short-subunit alcohol dehydrogenase family)
MKLRGKTALITGAARRIGREIALTLARDGAAVVVHYNHSLREAENLCLEIHDLGQDAWPVCCDFSKTSKSTAHSVGRFVREVYRKVKKVDILVNNASIFYPTPLVNIKDKDWDAFMLINLKVPFLLAQEIGLKMVKQKWGKIVNLVDWTIHRPAKDYLPYAISKAGLAAATIGLARNLAPYVHVVSIAPGPILPSAGMTASGRNEVTRRTLLKRFGTPTDIAETVRFFVENSGYMTGAFIPVDGGALIA